MAGLLDDMAAGWDGMQRGKIAERRKAQDRYDQALAAFLREWDDHQSPRYWQAGTVFASKQQRFRSTSTSGATRGAKCRPRRSTRSSFPRG
jgi:hypothetical protein